MSDELLFVYGTLRRGGGSTKTRLPAEHADFVGEATYQGQLYKVDYYPGAVPSDDPADVVLGEVYRLRDPAQVLAELDRFEGCGAGFPEPTEYVRQIQPVRLLGGRPTSAWVYVYHWPVDELERIPSGDFLERRDG